MVWNLILISIELNNFIYPLLLSFSFDWKDILNNQGVFFYLTSKKVVLKLIYNSSSLYKENHDREGGLDTRS